jgi:hypothetical protein
MVCCKKSSGNPTQPHISLTREQGRQHAAGLAPSHERCEPVQAGGDWRRPENFAVAPARSALQEPAPPLIVSRQAGGERQVLMHVALPCARSGTLDSDACCAPRYSGGMTGKDGRRIAQVDIPLAGEPTQPVTRGRAKNRSHDTTSQDVLVTVAQSWCNMIASSA